METIKKEWQAKWAVILFLLLTLWWGISFSINGENNVLSNFFGSAYGIMALWGAVWGFYIARQWGGNKSLIGKSILMFSLGLLAQEFGQIIYSYYVYITHIEIPYPSWGDLGYFGSIPLYIYGTIILAKASGVNISFKTFTTKLQAVLIPLALLLTSYIIFLKNYEFDWSSPLRVFLDFGYPFGQAIYISLALLTYLLSRNTLGGIMKSRVLFILFALFVQYLSDFTFLYQASKGTFQAGGIVDYMYLVSYFLMTIGLLQFNTVLEKLRYTEKK